MVKAGPVAECDPGAGVGYADCFRAIAGGVAVGRRAELGLNVRGGCVSNRVSATTATAVRTSATAALRTRGIPQRAPVMLPRRDT